VAVLTKWQKNNINMATSQTGIPKKVRPDLILSIIRVKQDPVRTIMHIVIIIIAGNRKGSDVRAIRGCVSLDSTL
jgi:hypothetical protein